VLTRTGEADAEAALFSLPLPRGRGVRLFSAHPRAGVQPLAWWERDKDPRRVLAAVAGKLPKTLKLTARRPAAAPEAPSPWTLSTPMTLERIPYVPHKFADIDGLRGVPAADCSTFEYALDLTYGGRTLRLQPGATGPGKAECLWQNVQIDRLWRNEAAEAVRVGGIIYNEDTYLWADLYLVLFANGVVSATLHFTNAKLHIKGYDFRGFPYLKIQGGGLKSVEADLPADGWRHDLGAATFNFADTAITCSEAHPARLRAIAGAVYYTPFDSIINTRKPESPADLWEPGFARTIRFQFSLSDAAPAVARYTVPAWWYAACGEPWPGGLLPVSGRFTPVAEAAGEMVRGGMSRGAFDGGSLAALGGAGNDGGAGAGLMEQAYLTGDPGLYRDALDYCTYWADLAVDHTDFTVHQWLGGWGWKTCAYTKFRDILFGYLETGDPWMRDTVEMTAEAYWAWFRSNWPRNAIGRDAFEVGGWALLWRYFRTEQARDRLRELVRMIGGVLESRGSAGGQMGAGPHPGWHASLYLTGVPLVGMMDALEAEAEAGGMPDAFLKPLEILHGHFIRDDVELFPVSLGKSSRATWTTGQVATWSLFGLYVYAGMGRRFGFGHPAVREGFAALVPCTGFDMREWGRGGRAGDQHLYPRAHDALMLEARVAEDGSGVDLAPAFGAATLPWPEKQTVETPWGALVVRAVEADGRVTLTLEAPADFRVRIRTAAGAVETRSCAEICL
jgi:hypothetical protein